MPIPFAREFEPFGADENHLGLGLGVESEQVQRAAKAQIINYIDEITEDLQKEWNRRDKNFYEVISGSYKEIPIPIVDKKNIFTGQHPVSQIFAPLNMWPRIEIYCQDASPYQFQEDNWDTFLTTLCIELFCKAGPVSQEDLHSRRGYELEQELDSITQRLTDIVHLCIRKDPTIGNVAAGEIEKPPSIKQSLPWSSKENTTDTGEYYIFQGKQIKYSVQKNSY